MGELLQFDGVTRLDINPDNVLTNATGKLKGVVVIGYTHDGGEFFASSYADGGDVLWHLERAKKALLEMVDVE